MFFLFGLGYIFGGGGYRPKTFIFLSLFSMATLDGFKKVMMVLLRNETHFSAANWCGGEV